MGKKIIDLSQSEFAPVDFKKDIENLRETFVWLLNNVREGFEIDAQMIGRCLFFFDLISVHDFVD